MKKRKSISQFDTLGIVVDLRNPEGLALAQVITQQTGDPELRNLIVMARTLGTAYVVAAGRFNGKGIFGTVCDNEQHVVVAIQTANARMKEIGSRTTAWMAKPDACAVLLERASGQLSL